ncbi:MAG: AmmeMemoRadiSam system protein B [Pseudomonadota bacterium]
MTRIRPAAVAGAFYPGATRELEQTVREFLSEADSSARTVPPKALIVPHAGYIYSGPIAATAYAQLSSIADRIRRVVILGPAHRVPVEGLALPDVDWFETPLGKVEVDKVPEIADLPQVGSNYYAHEEEHSLEVQLPFLQKVLREFKIVPLVVGRASPEEVAEVLERLWGGEETLIVISSDLSHYLPYADAQRTDQGTAKEILTWEVPITHEQACGATPVNGFLVAAKKHDLTGELLDLRNSGDTAGDRRQVVGYASFAFSKADGG